MTATRDTGPAGPATRVAPDSSSAIAATDEVEALVQAIRDAHQDGQAGVNEALGRLASDHRALLATLGEPVRGGITPLYNGPELTILNIIWAPLMVLAAHDHNMWASIGVYGGREDNIYWRQADKTIKAVGARSLGRGDVGALGRKGIHSVINPTQKLTAAIHVYGGDFFAPGRSVWEGEDLQQAPFSQEGLANHFIESNKRFAL